MEISESYCLNKESLHNLRKELVFKLDEASLNDFRPRFKLNMRAITALYEETELGRFPKELYDHISKYSEEIHQEAIQETIIEKILYPKGRTEDVFLHDLKLKLGIKPTNDYKSLILRCTHIRKVDIPEEVLEQLNPLLDQEYHTEEKFLRALTQTIGEQPAEYIATLLKGAKQQFPPYIPDQLEQLRDQCYYFKDKFVKALEKTIGQQKTDWYKTKILKHTHQKKEIKVKIVYYGPAFGGKTTSLNWLYCKLDPRKMNEFFSLDTEGDRTFFFDLLPLELGKVYDRDIRVKIYTVPGQVKYEKTRKMVLNGADAIVFVADSEKKRHKDNMESFINLAENLMANKLNIRTIPLVFQYNKRDLPEVLSIEFMDKKLNFRGVPAYGATAIELNDYGVLNCFIDVLKSLMDVVAERLKIGKDNKEITSVKSQLEETLRESV